MKTRLVSLLAVGAFLVGACSSSSAPPSSSGGGLASSTTPAPSGELTIYAAASLQNVLVKVKAAYQASNPGIALTVSAGSSAAIETQIEQGAPADVFLSADTANPAQLVAKGLAAGTPVTVARNVLTVIVPLDNPAHVASPADLAGSGVKVIAAGDSVPIAKYATQLVANLARQAGYPTDFVARYRANVVSKEDDASAVVAKIELGEGDAAIVYATDAKTSTKVTTIAVPAAANVPATYAGVVVRASKRTALATAFLAWLSGPDGEAILASVGFLPPR